MIIFGVDPGYAISGFGVISCSGGRFKTLDYGVIKTSSELSLDKRLLILYESYTELLEEFKPDYFAVEELFFNKNTKTAIMVSQARGVHLLAAARLKIPVFEYTPLQVKQGVVGYGRAEKIQVQTMIKTILNLKNLPKPDDAADALAVAVCHAHSMKLNGIK